MEYKFTSADFEKEVLQSDKPVLVDFFADWCGPCKMMAPVVEQLAEELEGKAKVGKLNIDENMDIAEKYRVMNIPTFLIFKDGQEKERIVGAVSKNELKNKLEQTLAEQPASVFSWRYAVFWKVSRGGEEPGGYEFKVEGKWVYVHTLFFAVGAF